MIRIVRPDQVPRPLATDGQQATALAVQEFRNDPSTFLQPGKEFNSKIYGHREVKNALTNAQHGKCCFCESMVVHISYGDVEHFRPKAAFIQADEPLQYPGYFWLAYEWTNLLFCCALCNQRHKKNQFPLSNPDQRATSPDHDVRNEQPLFVNPMDEDPAQFIGFRGDTPFPIANNERGRTSIAALGLNRETLRARRSSLLETLKYVYLVATRVGIQKEVEDALDLLRRAQDPESEYSATVRAAVADGFQYV